MCVNDSLQTSFISRVQRKLKMGVDVLKHVLSLTFHIKCLEFMFDVWRICKINILQNTANTITSIHMENLDKSSKLPSQIMEDLLTNFKIPEEKQVRYFCNL